MQTKTTTYLFIFLFLFGFSNCKEETLPIEVTANRAISGEWKLITWYQDGIEVTGEVVDYYLDFIIEEDHKGISRWETYTHRLLTSQDVPYEIINSGTSIDFDGKIFEIKYLANSTLVIEGEYNNQFWEIKAERP